MIIIYLYNLTFSYNPENFQILFNCHQQDQNYLLKINVDSQILKNLFIVISNLSYLKKVTIIINN